MAIAMFLKVDGATGESQDAAHQGWIDVHRLDWIACQKGNMASGGGGGAGRVNFDDLRVSGFMDKATPALIKHAASGKHLPEVKVSVCKAGGIQIEYATFVLKDVIVTKVSTVGSGVDVGVQYCFQAAKIEHHYWTQGKDGTRGAECQMGWDIKQNIATA
jgi:type VI secretion system secreted protein Hcp